MLCCLQTQNLEWSYERSRSFHLSLIVHLLGLWPLSFTPYLKTTTRVYFSASRLAGSSRKHADS